MNLNNELAAALEAARKAGELLRAEFHRPGGPRGSGGHADVDSQAEQLIHATLTGTFPDYGYLGEELPQFRRDRAGSPSWVVDPNDGTRAFLKGFRGSAVSIALVAGGLPVLGVVFAYSAADDDGDLFQWAEGCGPLLRNGLPCQRTWPADFNHARTVLVSQDADSNAGANAALAAPLRFRSVASIAYRLALLAAGEADGAVSLNAPRDWDYAGGHALLRGAGGELYSRDGREVRYDKFGRARSMDVFGGPQWLVDELRNRNWWPVFGGRGGETALTRPLRDRKVPDASRLRRAQGCLLGQFAGDSLGSLVEFQAAAGIRTRFPEGVRQLADGGVWGTLAGQPTDDSELALALARSIVQANGYEERAAATAYAAWYASDPFDIGNTTRVALSAAQRAIDRGESAAAGARSAASTTSQANGALMRISPLGVWAASAGLERGRECARTDAALTHPHPVCADANAAFVSAIAHAIDTGAGPHDTWLHAKQVAEGDILDVLHQAEHDPPASYSSQMGWVRIAFGNAFYQLLHAASLEQGVIDTVMRGGDTDTNAAIAGALLGAVHGRAAIPDQWLDRIITCRPGRGLPGVRRPRPEPYWPVDVLILAERLLIAGER